MAPIPKGLVTGVGKLIAGLLAATTATGLTTIEEPSPRGFLTGETGVGGEGIGAGALAICDIISANKTLASSLFMPLRAARIVAELSLETLETLETETLETVLRAMIETLSAPFPGGAPGWAETISTH